VKKAYQAFFTPARYEPTPLEKAVLARGDDTRIPFAGGALALTKWGNGQAVLLMHGWGGSRAQMTGFVDPLLAAGYRVVAFDQPAHGESDGIMTNLLEIAPAMDIMTQREGRFYAVIGHSFGTLITSYAIVHLGFPPPAKLAYFGSFNRLMDSLPRFQVLARLPESVVEGMRGMMYERFGQARLESITHEHLVPRIDIPALLFHDSGDEVTPIEDSRAIAKAWPRARLAETEGLGHRGALQSGQVIGQVVEFLRP